MRNIPATIRTLTNVLEESPELPSISMNHGYERSVQWNSHLNHYLANPNCSLNSSGLKTTGRTDVIISSGTRKTTRVSSNK